MEEERRSVLSNGREEAAWLIVGGRTAGSPSLSLSYSQLSIPPSFPLRLPLVSHELEVGQLCSRSLFIMLIGLRSPAFVPLHHKVSSSRSFCIFAPSASLSGLSSWIPFVKLVIYATRSRLLPRLNTNRGSLTLKQRLFCWFHLKPNVLNKVCWWILPATV